jgi:hypothetical protein
MKCACAILSSVACPALQYFSTLSSKRHIFRKKFLKSNCVFLFSLQPLSETLPILRKNERDIVKKSMGVHVKYPFFLCDFHKTGTFTADFRIILKYRTSRNSVHWEMSCSIRRDAQMDRRILRQGEANRHIWKLFKHV